MPNSGQVPFTQTARSYVPGTAIATDTEYPIGIVNLGSSGATGVITSASIVGAAAYTGANTNYRSFVIRNKGQAGSGTTVAAQLDGVSGVNLTAFDEKAITLSGTAANLVVTHGDVLAYYSLHAGTGIADPGGHVQVTYTRD